MVSGSDTPQSAEIMQAPKMVVETAPAKSSPHSALLARGDAGWTFPGRRQESSRASSVVAILSALLFHGALSLIRTDVGAKTTFTEPVQLETLIPIEAEPEPEVEAEPEPEKDLAPVPTTNSTLPAQDPISETPGAPDATEQDGPPPDELAAAIATAEGGDSNWEMLSGHGTALGRGGLGLPGRGNGSRARSTTLSARDLSRNAIPPNLAPIVQRNFPTAAKLARVSGTVTVSALIQPSGNPTDVRVESVTPRGRGFGETCSRTVHEGPDWKPKLNRDGRPVASRVTYTCRFKLPKSLIADAPGPMTGTGANRVWTRPAGG